MRNITLMTIFLLVSLPVSSIEEKSVFIGRILKYRGKVAKITKGSALPSSVMQGDSIFAGDIIKTEKGSLVKVLMNDDTIFQIGPQTKFEFQKFIMATKNDRQATYKIWHGKLRSLFVKKAKKGMLKIKTPTVAMGVRGTEILTDVYKVGNDIKTDIALLSGNLNIQQGKKDFKLKKGEHFSFSKSKKMQLIKNIPLTAFRQLKLSPKRGGKVFLFDALKEKGRKTASEVEFEFEEVKEIQIFNEPPEARDPASIKSFFEESPEVDEFKLAENLPDSLREEYKERLHENILDAIQESSEKVALEVANDVSREVAGPAAKKAASDVAYDAAEKAARFAADKVVERTVDRAVDNTISASRNRESGNAEIVSVEFAASEAAKAASRFEAKKEAGDFALKVSQKLAEKSAIEAAYQASYKESLKQASRTAFKTALKAGRVAAEKSGLVVDDKVVQEAAYIAAQIAAKKAAKKMAKKVAREIAPSIAKSIAYDAAKKASVKASKYAMKKAALEAGKRAVKEASRNSARMSARKATDSVNIHKAKASADDIRRKIHFDKFKRQEEFRNIKDSGTSGTSISNGGAGGAD